MARELTFSCNLSRELTFSCDLCGRTGLTRQNVWKVLIFCGKKRRNGEICEKCATTTFRAGKGEKNK